jgi:hypothetical protein
VIKNARALQSVAMSAVMAMTGWLLIVEHGDADTALGAVTSPDIPVTQALTQAPRDSAVQPVSLGDAVQQSVTQGGWAYFSVKAPAHANSLRVSLHSIDGDADLYVREGQIPEGNVSIGGYFDGSSATLGRQLEEVSLYGAADTQWFIAVHGYRAGQFSLKAEIH